MVWGDEVRKGAPKLLPLPRLGVLREYAWRHRVAGLLLSQEEVAICEDALEAVNPAPSRLDLPGADVAAGSELGPGYTWTDILDDWIHLALHVVENVRRGGDRDRFERWAGLLRSLPLSGEPLARLHYETCRMALSELDFSGVDDSLRAWDDDPNGFPFALTWKACIHAERGDWSTALTRVRRAFDYIREAQAAMEAPSVNLLSQEGWTKALLTLAEQVEADQEGDYDRMLAIDFRWQRKLSRAGANPYDTLSDLESEIEIAPGPPPPKERRRRSFDPRSHRTSRTLTRMGSGYDSDKIEAGQRALLVSEEGAVPHSPAPGFALRPLTVNGAAWCRLTHPEYALAVELQAGTDHLLEVLSRVRIGALDEAVVATIYARLQTATQADIAELKVVVPTYKGRRPVIRRLAPRLEVLSRLLFRLSHDNQEEATRLGVELMSIEAVQRDRNLQEAVTHLIKRGLRPLPDERRISLALEVIAEAPIPGIDFDAHGGDRWPILGRGETLFRYGTSISPDDVPIATVERLITVLGTAEDDDARLRAFWRLCAIESAGGLTESQRQELASTAVSPEKGTVRDDIGIRLSRLLKLPDPAHSRALVAAHALAEQDVKSQMHFQRVALVTDPPQLLSGGVLWSTEQALSLLSGIESWLEGAITDEERGVGRDQLAWERDIPQLSIVLGQAIMPAVDPSDEVVWNRIEALTDQLRSQRFPAGRALPFLLFRGGRQADEVASLLRIELASGDRRRIEQAGWGIADWLLWSEKGHQSPPDSLFEDAVFILAGERPEIASIAWAFTYWLLNANQTPPDRHVAQVASALRVLARRVDLPNPEDAFCLPPAGLDDETDDQLTAGAHLAAALKRHVAPESDAEGEVRRWQQISDASPFPDARDAWRNADGEAEVSEDPATSDVPKSNGREYVTAPNRE